MNREIAGILERGEAATADERFLLQCRYYQVELDPTKADEAARIAALLGSRG